MRCSCSLQVRLVFDAPASTGDAAQNGREAPEAHDSGSEGDKDEDNSEASGDDDLDDEVEGLKARRHRKKDSDAAEESKVQLVLKMLQQVSEEQVEDIGMVCRCAHCTVLFLLQQLLPCSQECMFRSLQSCSSMARHLPDCTQSSNHPHLACE